MNKPFLLKPASKDYLWGGNRLNDDFAKDIDMDPLAETWECSTHPDGLSTVDSGEFKGMSLTDVILSHPEYMGTHPNCPAGQIPILVKFIDAKQDLSVQVHPDDDYAREFENGQLGKTEMWYVLDAKKDAKLVYGFNHEIDKKTLADSIADGKLEKHLQKVRVEKDDVFFIEAGTVHAIGAGALIAEIQESSNLTYRLYDYNRVDKQGNLRELHVDKALQVANMKKSGNPRQPMRVLKYRPGVASEFLCRCKYFEVERVLINTDRQKTLAAFSSDSNSFQVFLCVGGCGTMILPDGESIVFFKGDCIFVPAESVEMKLHGQCQFLRVRC